MAKNKVKMNKFLTGAVTATMVATAVVPMASANVAATKEFTDVAATDSHYQNIMQAVERGLFKGYPNGTFKPYNDLTRGNVAKVLANYVVSQDGSADYAAYIEKHGLATDAKTFTDVPATTTDKELFNASLIVKAAGIFEGSNNNLMAAKTINRQQMAKVLVKAFGLQDLPGDLSTVTDNNKAFAEFVPFINILSENRVTEVSTYNPLAPVKRAQMASFLNRAFDIADKQVGAGVVSVSAINNTTVEVAFKEAVEDVKALNFKIEGLTVENAVVKQTGGDKVVVLTTSAQEGDKAYTVSLDGNKAGTFKGVSAVIPSAVDLVSKSTQGVLGKEVTLSAQVTVAEGQSKAGIPVTFSIPSAGSLTPAITVEATTNVNGVATYSYTRYAAIDDAVTVYANGDRSKFSTGHVFWGVATALTVEEVTTGDTINNGANKTYKVTYLNRTTGNPVANAQLNVSFKENINVAVDKTSNATVNGTNPLQLANGSKTDSVEVFTDSKGVATFTVSGTNTEVTPVVWVPAVAQTAANYSEAYSASLLQTSANKVVFSALQVAYTLEMTRNGDGTAARGLANGRQYTIIAKDKDGKPAKNEVVNLAFNEDLDRVIGTNTEAQFINVASNGTHTGWLGKTRTVKTNDKGEATFVIGSENGTDTDYATPMAWIDINTADANQGTFDSGEPSVVGTISYFTKAELTAGALSSYLGSVEEDAFTSNQTALFAFNLTNQSGKEILLGATPYDYVEVTYTVLNTGANDILVDGKTVSPNRSTTVSVNASNAIPNVPVTAKDSTKSASVSVTASAVAYDRVGTTNARPFTIGTTTAATATFTSTTAVPNLYTGLLASFNSNSNTMTFVGKSAVAYAGQTGKTYVYKNVSGNTLNLAQFEAELAATALATNTARITYQVVDDVVTVSIIDNAVSSGTLVDTVNVAPTQTFTGALTLTGSATPIDISGANTGTLTVSLDDMDLNLNTASIDTATVALKDSTNTVINLSLVETGVNTGIFTTTVQTGTLSAFNGGLLTATYLDAKDITGAAKTTTATVTLKTVAGALGSLTFTQANLVSNPTAAVYTSRSIDSAFLFTSGDSISLQVDAAASGSAISLTGKTGAQGVADAINTAALGATATVSGDKVVITSDTTGSASKANITASNISQVLVANSTGTAGNSTFAPATQALTIATVLAAGEKVAIDNETYALTAASAILQAAELTTAINGNASSAYTAVNTGAPSAVVTLTSKSTGAITAPVVKVIK